MSFIDLNKESEATYLNVGTNIVNVFIRIVSSAVADLGGAPHATKFFLISCSFRENLIKSYPGAPPGGWRPPWENPGSATEVGQFIKKYTENICQNEMECVNFP